MRPARRRLTLARGCRGTRGEKMAFQLFKRLFSGGSSEVERRRNERVNARSGTRVLVIDDSATVLAMFRKVLRSAGYVVIEAEDAEKGLALAHSEKPELIFLDIVLPGMNGFAALRRLRRDPQTEPIPVIMISGNPRSINIFRNSRVDADGFIKKPFTRSEIFTRVEKMLNQDRVPKRLNALRTKPESGFLKRFGRRLNNPLTV